MGSLASLTAPEYQQRLAQRWFGTAFEVLGEMLSRGPKISEHEHFFDRPTNVTGDIGRMRSHRDFNSGIR